MHVCALSLSLLSYPVKKFLFVLDIGFWLVSFCFVLIFWNVKSFPCYGKSTQQNACTVILTLHGEKWTLLGSGARDLGTQCTVVSFLCTPRVLVPPES